jgi:hypothetical protein
MTKSSSPHTAVFMTEGIRRLNDVLGGDPFVFVINEQEYVVTVIEAIFLSSHVASALKMDNTVSQFVIHENENEIDASLVTDLVRLIHGEQITITASRRKSMILLSRHLGNQYLERLFFGLRSSDDTTTTSDFGCDLTSCTIEDLALFDIMALQEIVSSESLRIPSEDWLLRAILTLGTEYSSLLEQIHLEFLSDDGLSLFIGSITYCNLTDGMWCGIVRLFQKVKDPTLERLRFAVRPLDSLIIPSIPSIFDDLDHKTFHLLYRGSRDGFVPKRLHEKVDGHSNTITFVETTKGFIFGAFTPCMWDSSDTWKCDNSLKSFLFTLKNPHNIAARKFALKAEEKAWAMCCYINARLAYFGQGGGISLYEGCNVNTTSNNCGWGRQDATYVNDTDFNSCTLFTGETNFTVKELEIFELID